MIQIKPLLDICGIVYSEKQLVLLQKNLLELIKKIVEKITSERKVLDEKRVEIPPKRPEIYFIEGKKDQSRKCRDAEDIEIALKLIYQSKYEKQFCEKEKDILKKVDENILKLPNEKLFDKDDSKNVENTVFESPDLNKEDSMTRILLESNHESENPKSDNIEIENNVFESLEIESDDYEEAEENKINFENEKNSGKSQVNVMCKICQKPYVGLLKVG